MSGLISDEQCQQAFDWLHDNADAAAAARAHRERCEYAVKLAKSKAFLAAEGTQGEREHKAIASNRYLEAVERLVDAVQADEYQRNQRSKAVAVIDAWRTVKSTERAMEKFR